MDIDFSVKMKSLFFTILCLFNLLGNAQNLASDGSFENYKRCPQNLIGQTSEFMLKEWTIPTQGTTDYFNRCSKIKNAASVPDNQVGHQEALTGNGYIGLRYRKSGDYSESVSYTHLTLPTTPYV